ncbi:Putative fungal transcription factor [Septoria linicola]|uniref:Fungal transcription factor n=1 Tax=Septoria linicola TaxID=215465 RepID=A0A9Q9B3V5_9PEZI|nr:putative fungal transcription factor [Septoria linicola]USW55826.1 Putative fungal transcription factor [Septoria linicola]
MSKSMPAPHPSGMASLTGAVLMDDSDIHYGLACGGYKAKIAFDTDGAAPDTLRRPLYTTQEQRQMTIALVTSAPLSTLHKVLVRLDESTPTTEVISSGPFAVFQAHEQATAQISPQSSSTIELAEEAIPFDVLSDPTALASSEAIDALFPDLFPNVAGAGYDFMDSAPDLFADLTDTTPLGFASTTIPASEPFPLCLVNDNWLSPSIAHMPFSQSRLPSEATFLLTNFKDTVVAYLTPLHRRKTIWHVLYVPSAMTSAAALAMGEDPSSAQLAVLHAMLSISANCLAGESEGKATDFWRSKGSEYKGKAQQSLNQTLKELSSERKMAKYKELLMVLLAMVIVVTFAGDSTSAQLFLYDADKLIRLKGLRKKPKSRRVRMLHHYYSYLRIFYESMSQQKSSLADQQYRCAPTEGEDRIDLEARRDHPFRLARWQLSLDQKMLEKKTRERGENDLCLQEPGVWSSTMYLEVFGVPESWLILLSQAIRLGNERDIASEECDDSALSWQEFTSRARVLERCISSWSPPEVHLRSEQCHRTQPGASDDGTAAVIEDVLSCLHSALRIYFYRRIYNVDAAILQQQVSGIRQVLQKWASDSQLKHCAGLIWPALIGACEAIDEDDQVFFQEWFAELMSAGFVTARSAVTVISYVWQQRRDTRDNTVSWTQYLTNHRVNLVFF